MFFRSFHNIMRFLRVEAASGIILVSVTMVAIFLANSPLHESYQSILHYHVKGMSVLHWINDCLMTIFFLVVGLEIKREILSGELSTVKKAALPAIAAVGGMLIPALIYLCFNWKGANASGWGVPMATDIAFVVGVMALLGKRVPIALKFFLVALAIVDDIGAVIVIAAAYTHHFNLFFLFLAGITVALLGVYNKAGIHNVVFYLVFGVILWVFVLKSGVHATIAGVLLALTMPSSIGTTLEKALHPFVSFGIMPLFALANAGISLSGSGLFTPVSLGIIAGLVIGKQLGITFFSWLAVRIGLAVLPDRVSWRHIYGAACLGGIGFTMSIFMANLALDSVDLVETAKMAVMIASIVSCGVGAIVLAAKRR